LNPIPGGKGILHVTVSTHAGNPRQVMEVWAEGQRLHGGAVPVLESGSGKEFSIALPDAIAAAGVARFEFRFSQWNPRGPKEREEYAVAFHSLRLE
jgi:hypothetical protein